MSPLLCAILLLGISSLANAANFTQVFQLNNLDYEWPAEANRTQALKDGTFEPENISPRYMAVYGSRIFLSLHKNYGIPVSLVSLPTASASSAFPKLTPFPSWDMHFYGNCSKIEDARGLQVDSVGRLWVLDNGSDACNSKLWIIDLNNNNETKLIHKFPFHYFMHDFVLDETPNDTFAYIMRWEEEHIVVFSLEKNQSWIVHTPQVDGFSIAMSPKDQEPRQIYFGKQRSNEVYSIPVGPLRNGTGIANPKLIGNSIRIDSYRMLMDDHGTLYTSFFFTNYILSWNTSQPIQEQRFHQIAHMFHSWPYTFALDQNETIWMTVNCRSQNPRYRLLKIAVDV